MNSQFRSTGHQHMGFNVISSVNILKEQGLLEQESFYVVYVAFITAHIERCDRMIITRDNTHIAMKKGALFANILELPNIPEQ